MLFGRADEEMRALRAAGIAFEIVPGVSAAFAAAADLQVSLTRRGVARSVAFLTPCIGTDEAKSNWIDVASSVDTAVIYMAGRNLAVVAAIAVLAGVAFAQKARLSGQSGGEVPRVASITTLAALVPNSEFLQRAYVL